jgi:hypothetical protein
VNVRRALGESVSEELEALGENELDDLVDESMGINAMEMGR